jgi:hypothetical protein
LECFTSCLGRLPWVGGDTTEGVLVLLDVELVAAGAGDEVATAGADVELDPNDSAAALAPKSNA